MTTSPANETAAPNILRRLGQELAKFGAVGIVGVVVQLLALTVLLDMMPGATVRANIVATLIAIGTNYIGYRYWVYRDTDKKTRAHEIMLFLVFSGIGLVIQNGVLFLLTYGLNMKSHLATFMFTVIGIGVATLFRFWAYRTWVFSGTGGAKADADQADASDTGAVEQAERILAAEHVKAKRSTAPKV